MTRLTDAELKTIIARRDRRYDGRFFFGEKTTRIYCRPTCPARPKPDNILIFRSHAEAEKAGYRPCLRCRPDAAGPAAWLRRHRDLEGPPVRVDCLELCASELHPAGAVHTAPSVSSSQPLDVSLLLDALTAL